jgi:hypothetical protein
MKQVLLFCLIALSVGMTTLPVRADDHHGDRDAERRRCEDERRQEREERERWEALQRSQARMEAIILGTCNNGCDAAERERRERLERERRAAERLRQQQGTW